MSKIKGSGIEKQAKSNENFVLFPLLIRFPDPAPPVTPAGRRMRLPDLLSGIFLYNETINQKGI